MKQFECTVRKLTDEELMKDACEMTFAGTSNQSLLSIYKSEHSPVRTQLFWIKLKGIPLYVSTHLLRHHVGSQPFQLTCRDDRNGGNPGFIKKIDAINENLANALNGAQNGDYDFLESVLSDAIDELKWLQGNADRYTPVNLGIFVNAQSLIDMSKLRLCAQASAETRVVFQTIKAKVWEIDPSLAALMVRKCVYRGGICGEPKCCGYNGTQTFKTELSSYLSNFNQKQLGIHYENY